ncbi:hypothetical protein [Clostridium perfringens]|uniref:hypothetical protein n=1 Tax=Clostridium perfringens TaxID=1502 RepID=UPI003D33808A
MNSILYFSIFYILFLLIPLVYLASTYPLYVMAKKANLKNPKYMFIPIVNYFKMVNLAGYTNGIAVLMLILAFIPFVSIITSIFSIVVYVKVINRYNISTLLKVLGFFFTPFIYWYIALDDDVICIDKCEDEFAETIYEDDETIYEE